MKKQRIYSKNNISWALITLLTYLLVPSVLFAGGRISPSLVSRQWVEKNWRTIKIIDLRDQDYAEGHIPGALQMKSSTEVYAQGTDYGLPPNLSETKRVIKKMGLEPEDHIVLYGGSINMRHAIRTYWALKYWNFPKVSIMNGGFALWQRENRPVIHDTTIASQEID